MRRGARFTAAAATLAVALAAPSVAAARPTATTGGVSSVGQQTATVHGTVDPNGGATTYWFEYGTTGIYQARTGDTSAGAGAAPVKVSAALGGLAPATTYHYRLVARGPGGGIALGGDRTFKTRRQPLGVTLAGNPNPVRAGSPTIMWGALTGTGNASRQVVLQSNPFPYTQGFADVANPQVTAADGSFSFPVLSVPVNTQFRVFMPANKDVISPIVVVGAKVRVTTHLRVTRGTRTGVVRLSGHLTPATDGTQVLIQKFVGDRWRNIGETVARHSSSTASSYSKSVRQREPGRYRAMVVPVGAYTPNVGKTVRVRHIHR
jgi:hypothetical protein